MRHLLIFVFLLFGFCLVVPVSAQTDPEVAQPDQSDSDFPEVGSISESVAKALRTFRADQKFQQLRDERIQLLESIPETRAKVQAQEGDLARLDAEIADLESKIKASESAVESEELTTLRYDLARAEAFLERENARAAELTERRKAIEDSLTIQIGRVSELEIELKSIEVKLESSRMAEVQAEADFRKIMAPLEAKIAEAEGLIGILEEESKLSEDESVLEELFAKRREVIAIQAETYSDEIIDARADIGAAEAALAGLLEAEKKRSLALNGARDRSFELEADIRDLIEDEQRLASNISDISFEIRHLHDAIARQSELDKNLADNPEDLMALRTELVEKRKNDDGARKESIEKLQKDILRQTTVENEINDLFIPRSAENSFKLWMSFVFAFLVGLVIWKFFGITREDENVRRVVFSAEAGIQFVTLFSLVIAIILFGITGILEGKELSALLGGISGYILGRATSGRGEGGPSPDRGPS